MIEYASPHRLSIQARRAALEHDQRAPYGAALEAIETRMRQHSTGRGRLPAELQDLAQDWALTHVETGWDYARYADPEHVRTAVEAYEVNAEAERILRREAAVRIVRQGKGGAGPIEPDRLDDLLAEPDQDAEFRIEGLLPTGGRAVLSAAYKAGKSTLAGNLIRCLVDDEPFLGQFPVEPAERVLLIDNELDPRTLKRWLRDHGIRNTHRVDVLSLRGRVSSFDLLDEEARTAWARKCEGADFIILDCLRPVLDSLGLDENREAGRFLVAFDAFLAEAGAEEAVLVHHMGHNGERSRGDSRILDWPDVTWKLLIEDADDRSSPRYFSAFGRDVDIKEGRLDHDTETRRLTLAGGSRKTAKAAYKLPDVLDFLGKSPGTSLRGIKEAIPGSDSDTAKAVAIGIEEGLIRREERKGRGAGWAHFLHQNPNRGEPRRTEAASLPK